MARSIVSASIWLKICFTLPAWILRTHDNCFKLSRLKLLIPLPEFILNPLFNPRARISLLFVVFLILCLLFYVISTELSCNAYWNLSYVSRNFSEVHFLLSNFGNLNTGNGQWASFLFVIMNPYQVIFMKFKFDLNVYNLGKVDDRMVICIFLPLSEQVIQGFSSGFLNPLKKSVLSKPKYFLFSFFIFYFFFLNRVVESFRVQQRGVSGIDFLTFYVTFGLKE